MSKVYEQINSIAGIAGTAFGGGGGGGGGGSRRKTLGPGGGSDPGNIANDYGTNDRAPRKAGACAVVGTLSGAMAAIASKNPKAGVATGMQTYLSCKVGTNLD